MRALIADIDGTLTGDPAGVESLMELLNKSKNVLLVYATGRDRSEFEDALDSEGIPVPDAAIIDTGAEILIKDGEGFISDRGWESRLRSAAWNRKAVLELGKGIPGLTPQQKNHPYKVSFFVERGNRAPVHAAIKALSQAGIQSNPVPSHESFLDIMPEGCDKGTAAVYLMEKMKIEKSDVVVAGDSENDLALFREFANGIVVGNARSGLLDALKGSGHFFASKSSASGTHEGLIHYITKRNGRGAS